VIRGADGDHRLAGRVVSAPADGGSWSAAFLWREAPIAFETAGLELGEGRIVTLPAPGPAAQAGQRLDIRVSRPPHEPADVPARPMAGALRLQAALVAAEDEARHAHAAREGLEEELARARQDIVRHQARHAADAERFRAGLATVQEVGEQALAEALDENARLQGRLGELQRVAEDNAGLRAELDRMRSANADLQAELERAGEASAGMRTEFDRMTAANAALRAELDDAVAANADLRAELDQAVAANADLRAELDQVAGSTTQVEADLERVGAENAALRLELEQLGAEHARARSEIERLGTEAAAMRDGIEEARVARQDADRLRKRLAAVRAAIGQDE
jgi:chromosome segregation ATPase